MGEAMTQFTDWLDDWMFKAYYGAPPSDVTERAFADAVNKMMEAAYKAHKAYDKGDELAARETLKGALTIEQRLETAVTAGKLVLEQLQETLKEAGHK